MNTFDFFDAMRAKVERHKIEPLFSVEINSRNNRYENTILEENNNLLRVMAKLIAYSNNAPSDKVEDLLKSDRLDKVFHNFDPTRVAIEDPESLILKEWHNLKAIRFKKKLKYIIICAKLLLLNDSKGNKIDFFYQKYHLPTALNTKSDIDLFWKIFEVILEKYKKESMPYFNNHTSLLHLLLHIGYPCVKPDLIVMKVAASLGIIESKINHNSYNNQERISVVKTIQNYCLLRDIKPAVMDFYTLIYGGQKGAMRYVDHKFIPLSSST